MKAIIRIIRPYGNRHCILRLHIGHQSFDIGPRDPISPSEALWYRRTIHAALRRLKK